MRHISDSDSCPCLSQKIYANCCGPYHLESAVAQTPEALMRSRYTAFYLGLFSYIQKTMTGPALKLYEQSPASTDSNPQWVKLDVLSASKNYVHFRAYYQEGIKLNWIEEKSEFVQKAGTWYYYQAKSHPSPNRNEMCPCDSGKKYKKCCMTQKR